jgi:hydrogenase-1 operon protein HyaF
MRGGRYQQENEAMSGLDAIPVKVESTTEKAFRTQNLQPLLLQVREALKNLAETGETTTIDLGAMPFSEQDENDLRAALGAGEVSAEVRAFGPTLIQETAVAGIWLIELKDVEEKRLTLHLEVTYVPAILMTPAEDVAEGVERIDALLTEMASGAQA